MFENPRSLDVDRARGFETKIQTNGKEPFQKVIQDIEGTRQEAREVALKVRGLDAMSIFSFKPTRVLPYVCGDMYQSLPCGCMEKYECAASASLTRRAGRASEPFTITHAQRVASRAAESRGGRLRERSKNIVGERNRVVPGLGSGTVAKQETIMEAGARQRRTPQSRAPSSRAPAPALNWMSTPLARVHAMISICRSARAASTCEPMLGNAGAPAPLLHMLMPHRKPPPPTPPLASDGAGNRGGSESQHHPRLDVFGSGSRARANTCADARTGIAASSTARGLSLFVTIRGLFGFGARSASKRTRGVEVEVDAALVNVDVGIEGEAMEEEVDSEGVKDGESVIEPEAGCVVDILFSFALLNPAEGETKKTARTEEREWRDLRDDDGESQFGYK
ncbi:hypothetical protein K438DRAFT_1783887 [Mycena galopus ATCC 62051]|nr:hypothetical protein K438DRAFT_1783887 [Mycena galopus ATCC 62051]